MIAMTTKTKEAIQKALDEKAELIGDGKDWLKLASTICATVSDVLQNTEGSYNNTAVKMHDASEELHWLVAEWGLADKETSTSTTVAAGRTTFSVPTPPKRGGELT